MLCPYGRNEYPDLWIPPCGAHKPGEEKSYSKKWGGGRWVAPTGPRDCSGGPYGLFKQLHEFA